MFERTPGSSVLPEALPEALPEVLPEDRLRHPADSGLREGEGVKSVYRSRPCFRGMEFAMADKSPKKASGKTAAAKSLKEKRADKKAKTSSKSLSS